MADRADWPPPMAMIGYAVGLAIMVGAVGVVLYFVLPVVGTAIGLGVAVSVTGLSTAGAVSVWVAPVASAGVALAGVTIAATAVKKVADNAQEKPYEWGLPILAAFAGFMSTVARDSGLVSNASKWLFAGITALLIVVAASCYKRPALRWKGTAIALFLLPPVVLLAWSMLASGQSSLVSSFRGVSTRTWIGLSCIVVIGVLIGLLARLADVRHRTV